MATLLAAHCLRYWLCQEYFAAGGFRVSRLGYATPEWEHTTLIDADAKLDAAPALALTLQQSRPRGLYRFMSYFRRVSA